MIATAASVVNACQTQTGVATGIYILFNEIILLLIARGGEK